MVVSSDNYFYKATHEHKINLILKIYSFLCKVICMLKKNQDEWKQPVFQVCYTNVTAVKILNMSIGLIWFWLIVKNIFIINKCKKLIYCISKTLILSSENYIR